MRRTNQVLIDCSGPPDEPRNEETGMARKRDALLSQLERRMALRTLIFCNTIQGCRQASLLCGGPGLLRLYAEK